MAVNTTPLKCTPFISGNRLLRNVRLHEAGLENNGKQSKLGGGGGGGEGEEEGVWTSIQLKQALAVAVTLGCGPWGLDDQSN